MENQRLPLAFDVNRRHPMFTTAGFFMELNVFAKFTSPMFSNNSRLEPTARQWAFDDSRSMAYGEVAGTI
jgi:hypothetical protein